jgi:hypothetical protein
VAFQVELHRWEAVEKMELLIKPVNKVEQNSYHIASEVEQNTRQMAREAAQNSQQIVREAVKLNFKLLKPQFYFRRIRNFRIHVHRLERHSTVGAPRNACTNSTQEKEAK